MDRSVRRARAAGLLVMGHIFQACAEEVLQQQEAPDKDQVTPWLLTCHKQKKNAQAFGGMARVQQVYRPLFSVIISWRLPHEPVADGPKVRSGLGMSFTVQSVPTMNCFLHYLPALAVRKARTETVLWLGGDR